MTFLIQLQQFSEAVRRWGFACAVLTITFCFLYPITGVTCGMAWAEPRSYFDGVDYQGNVLLVEHFGEIEAGDGLHFPFYAVFNSNSGNNSPYAGYGWTVPLLEAKFSQYDENTFRLDQPDGWFRMFWRSKNSADVLEGQGGWKAAIRGDSVTAWADCGTKLTFIKGRLRSMEINGRRLDFVYEGSQLTEIKGGLASILRVEREQMSGEAVGFFVSNRGHIGLKRDKRPRVQVVDKQMLVTGIDPSLSEVVFPDGTKHIIEYGISKSFNSTIKFGDRLITWDPSSRKIIKDGEWRYDIEAGRGGFDNAAIGRRNAKNEREFWHMDGAKGEETIMEINGETKKATFFKGGVLDGRMRRVITTTKDGGQIEIYSASYDERGNLLRKIDSTGIEEGYKYDGDGRITEIRRKGEVVREFNYSSNGDYVVKINSPGGQIVLEYDKLGRLLSGTDSKNPPIDLAKVRMEVIEIFGSDRVKSDTGRK